MARARKTLVIKSQPVAIALGIAFLGGAMWAFGQAWEDRGKERPRIARLMAV